MQVVEVSTLIKSFLVISLNSLLDGDSQSKETVRLKIDSLFHSGNDSQAKENVRIDPLFHNLGDDSHAKENVSLNIDSLFHNLLGDDSHAKENFSLNIDSLFHNLGDDSQAKENISLKIDTLFHYFDNLTTIDNMEYIEKKINSLDLNLLSLYSEWSSEVKNRFILESVDQVFSFDKNVVEYVLKRYGHNESSLDMIFGNFEESILVFPYRDLIKKWAPKLILSEEEKYYPSNVDLLLNKVEYIADFEMQNDEIIMTGRLEGPFDVYNLPTGSAKTAMHFDLNNSTVKYGSSLSDVPIYALVKKNDTKLTILYHVFYVYNEGKLGLGNHFGDFETIEVTLIDGRPYKIELHFHEWTENYYWNGENFTNNISYISLDGSHPILFVAKGSHGHWPEAGSYNYFTILGMLKLYDVCSYGVEWKTWNTMKMVNFIDPNRKHMGEYSFINYVGRWGNYAKGPCQLCNLTPGPIMSWQGNEIR